MSAGKSQKEGQAAGKSRDERLKAALKANLQKRKAQARKRGDKATETSSD